MTQIPTPYAIFETYLANAIGTGDTSMTLANGVDSSGNTLTGLICFTIDQGTPTQEFVVGTASGTSITGMTRGLNTLGGTATYAGNVYSHRRGADVKITDWSLIGILAGILNGTNTVPNVMSYANTNVFTNPNQIVTKAYADSVGTGGATYLSNVITGVSGSALTAGQWVYFNTSTQQWNLTSASTASTFQNQRIGVCQTTVSGSGQSIGVLISGLDLTQTGLTPGAKYFLSNTSGAITTSTSQANVVFVGWALNTTSIMLSYRFDTAGAPYIFNAQYASAEVTDTISSNAVTINWNQGNVHYIQLINGANNAITLTNPTAGGRYILILQQPASSTAGTVTWSTTINWTGGSAPTLTTTNSKVDVISLIYDSQNAGGATYYGSTSYNF